MDQIDEFRALIMTTITEWAEFLGAPPGVENVLVFDEKSDNYLWVYTGWEGKVHVNHTVVHMAIRDGKIHVYHDGTEEGVVPDLIKAGVPEKSLVIEWHPPYQRQYTPFALA